MAAKPSPPPPPAPSPTATPTPTPTPTATPTPVVKKLRRRRHAHTPVATPAGSPIGQATPAGGAVITTGGSDAERHDIEQGIKRVEAWMATVQRSRLDAQDSSDYDRIKSFVADARSALHEQDDLRARSLVDKAARLASQLAQRISGP